MDDLVTTVSVHNPLFSKIYTFPCDKESFMESYCNQLAGSGYYVGTSLDGTTVTINPTNCALIEINEVDLKD